MKWGFGTIAASALQVVLIGLEDAGVDPAGLLAQAGLKPEDLTDPGCRVPGPVAARLWTDAVRASGDVDFGLHLAEGRAREEHGAFEYALRSAATLGEAWHRADRYIRVVQDDGSQLRLKLKGDRATMTFHFRMPVLLPRAIPDLILASLVVNGRWVTNTDWDPLEVSFIHPQPADTREYERIFRAPVQFSARSNSIVVAASLLDTPQETADPRLAEILDRYLCELMARLPRHGGVAERVVEALLANLMNGEVSVRAVARLLNLSSRTLHRRLRDQGTSFSSLLDETRFKMASVYLENHDNTVSEIAFLLGYTETSAFFRAFRRWTGTTPVAYQHSLQVAASCELSHQ